MSLLKLPTVTTDANPKNFRWDCRAPAMDTWAKMPIQAAAENRTIDIFDVIGENPFSDDITVQTVTSALNKFGSGDINVRLNSPGGDLFEGLAIYNALVRHDGAVNVEVLGIAGSAASIIAMAGDDIAMALGTFMFIHNAWGSVVGNRHDMAEGVELFTAFDEAIVDIYQARTKGDRKKIGALMDKETLMPATKAMNEGFATRLDETLEAPSATMKNEHDIAPTLARRQIESALANQGLVRKDRTEVIAALMKEPAGARDAAGNAARDAGDVETSEILRAIRNLQF